MMHMKRRGITRLFKNQKLQLHQFEINKDNIVDKELFVYSWPEKLIDKVLDSNDNSLKCAIRNLSEIISLAIDEVVYTRNNVSREQKVEADRFWIFSLKEISTATVAALIQEWLIVSDIKAFTIDDLFIKKPTKIITKQLFETTYKFDIYGVIPQLYNFEFCRNKIEMHSLNDRELVFYPVIDTKREAVAISNTFDYPIKKADVERFSYSITFSLVNNREFPDKIFLNVYTGIKVWVCKPLVDVAKSKNFITSKNSSSVYVYKENEYLNNKRKKLIRIMYTRDNKRHFQFSGVADIILAELMKLNLLDALTNPNNYSDFLSSDANDIVLLTNNKITEKVQYGAGLPERLDIFNAFRNLFPDLYVRELIGVADAKGLSVSKKRKSLEDIEGFNNQFDDYEFIDSKSDKSFYENPPVFIPYEDKMVCQHFFVQLLFGHFSQTIFYRRHIIKCSMNSFIIVPLYIISQFFF